MILTNKNTLVFQIVRGIKLVTCLVKSCKSRIQSVGTLVLLMVDLSTGWVWISPSIRIARVNLISSTLSKFCGLVCLNSWKFLLASSFRYGNDFPYYSTWQCLALFSCVPVWGKTYSRIMYENDDSTTLADVHLWPTAGDTFIRQKCNYECTCLPQLYISWCNFKLDFTIVNSLVYHMN